MPPTHCIGGIFELYEDALSLLVYKAKLAIGTKIRVHLHHHDLQFMAVSDGALREVCAIVCGFHPMHA